MKFITIFGKICWATGIFTLPFGASILIHQTVSAGNFNPYTGEAILLSECLILMASFISLLQKPPKKSRNENKIRIAISLMMLGFLFLSVAMSQDKIASLTSLIPWITGLGAIRLIHKELLPLTVVKQIFVATMGIQATIAISQMVLQHSIGLALIGEPLINATAPGVAKINIIDHTLIRAYGTFPHPNILAGFSAIALFLIKSIPQKWQNIMTAILGIGILLSASKAVFLGLIITFILIKKVRKRAILRLAIISGIILIIAFPQLMRQEFVNERLLYLKISGQMALHTPQGVGIGQFTERMQEFSTLKLQPWQYQPVHNGYLLILNEMGIWTLLFMGMGLQKIFRKKKDLLNLAPLILLMTISLFDHYPVSLPQGILLTTLIIGITTYPSTAPIKSG